MSGSPNSVMAKQQICSERVRTPVTLLDDFYIKTQKNGLYIIIHSSYRLNSSTSDLQKE